MRPGKGFAECPMSDTRQTPALPSARSGALSKPIFLFSHCACVRPVGGLPSVPDLTLGKPAIVADYQILGPRQTCLLCRVSDTGHSAKTGPEHTNISALPSVTAHTLGKEAILVLKCTDFSHVSSLPSVFTLALGKMPLCRV